MLEGARKFGFPEGLLDGEPDAVLLCIPVPVVPYFRRFFAQMEMPYIWKARGDFERAYPVFAEIEAQMTRASCVSSVVESVDRVYRLLDSALNGAVYSEAGGLVEPAIPAAPADVAPDELPAAALRRRIERLIAGVDGGADPRPGDNLLTALRGTTAAGVDRNVIDKIGQLDTLLAEIRDLLQ